MKNISKNNTNRDSDKKLIDHNKFYTICAVILLTFTMLAQNLYFVESFYFFVMAITTALFIMTHLILDIIKFFLTQRRKDT